MQRMWGVKKVFSFMFLALMISVLLAACGGGGGGSDGGGGGSSNSSSNNNNPTPTPNNNATITGTVSGTTVKAFGLSGNEVASNTATGNPKTFSLNVPAGGSYKFYLIENENTANERVYVLYQGNTNVFNIASAVTINLGFVDTSTGKAVPTNNPLNVSGVTSGGENTTIPPSLLLLFSVTNNPSTGNDWANNIAIDSNYMYIVGSEYTSGDEKWRIEKRNLSDGALVPGFGTAGVIISNPSGGSAAAFMIAIDSTYMYVVGSDNSTGSYQWRIEKRNLSDGALVSGFGTAGVVTTNPSTGADEPFGIAIDSIYMYIVGYDTSIGVNNQQWRIEKRNLSDGALASGFGTAGVVTNDPSTGNDKAFRIAIDSTYMYVVGRDEITGPGYQWRIEKRNLSDGALVSGFGTAGVVTTNPGAGADDEPYGIAIDSTYMYVVGYDTSIGVNNQQWRIEKRNLSDGALVSGFGAGGVVTSNPSTGQDGGFNIAIDSTYMYVVGYDNNPGNVQWRIEKRNLSDGALAAGFGAGGVVTNDPSTGVDIAYGIAIDSTYMYVIGSDNSPGNGQWRIEKRRKGSLFSLADLQGTWNFHAIQTGDSPQWTGWMYGQFTIDSNGNYTATYQKSDNTSGSLNPATLAITSAGVITDPTNTSLHWVMNINKDLIVGTLSDLSPSGGYVLFVMQKAGGTFAQSDLTGTWKYHMLTSGDGPQTNGWEYGTVVIDGSGNATYTSIIRSNGDSTLRTPTTFPIISSGVVSHTGESSFNGMMSQDKNMVIATRNGDSGGYSLVIAQKSGGTFAQSDLTGAWNFHLLTSGDSPQAQFIGWAYGAGNIDSSGNATGTSITRSNGDSSTTGGPVTFSITSSGVVKGTIDPSFHCVMSLDKSMMVATMNDGGGGYDLFIWMK